MQGKGASFLCISSFLFLSRRSQPKGMVTPPSLFRLALPLAFMRHPALLYIFFNSFALLAARLQAKVKKNQRAGGCSHFIGKGKGQLNCTLLPFIIICLKTKIGQEQDQLKLVKNKLKARVLKEIKLNFHTFNIFPFYFYNSLCLKKNTPCISHHSLGLLRLVFCALCFLLRVSFYFFFTFTCVSSPLF